MKQIINNVLYDTDKSTLIFSHGRSTLYKTNKNNFFIVAKWDDAHIWIERVSKDEVKERIGRYAPDLYKEIFPEEKVEEY